MNAAELKEFMKKYKKTEEELGKPIGVEFASEKQEEEPEETADEINTDNLQSESKPEPKPEPIVQKQAEVVEKQTSVPKQEIKEKGEQQPPVKSSPSSNIYQTITENPEIVLNVFPSVVLIELALIKRRQEQEVLRQSMGL